MLGFKYNLTIDKKGLKKWKKWRVEQPVVRAKKMPEQGVIPSTINVVSSCVTTHGGLWPFFDRGEAVKKSETEDGGDNDKFE